MAEISENPNVLDFTKTLSDIGKLFTVGFRQRIERQTGIDGGRYARPKMSTLKSRERLLAGTTLASRAALLDKMGVKRGQTLRGTKRGAKHISTSIARLYVTHDLAVRGFRSESSPNMVRIFVSDAPHTPFYGTNPTLRQIIQWNSRGQDENTSSSSPLVFPTTRQEVMAIQPEFSRAGQMIKTEANRQIKDMAKMNLTIKVNIGRSVNNL